MKVIIAGGREFNDYDMLVAKMDKILTRVNKDKLVIVSGGARGADALGERYAKERGYTLEIYKADWTRLGKAAGFARNTEMARIADALVAFPGGNGTAHMIRTARDRNLKVRVIEDD